LDLAAGMMMARSLEIVLIIIASVTGVGVVIMELLRTHAMRSKEKWEASQKAKRVKRGLRRRVPHARALRGRSAPRALE